MRKKTVIEINWKDRSIIVDDYNNKTEFIFEERNGQLFKNSFPFSEVKKLDPSDPNFIRTHTHTHTDIWEDYEDEYYDITDFDEFSDYLLSLTE